MGRKEREQLYHYAQGVGGPAELDTFMRFCTAADQAKESVLGLLKDMVRGHMARAGEDYNDEVLVAVRTRQFIYSLDSRAEREAVEAQTGRSVADLRAENQRLLEDHGALCRSRVSGESEDRCNCRDDEP